MNETPLRQEEQESAAPELVEIRIRPHLERAVDDVRYFLNGEKENQKAREESAELYDLMEANKTPPEVKGQGSPKLAPEQYAAIEWRTADGKPITDEQREAILAGVLPGQPISDERCAAHHRAFRGGWRESSRQLADCLRKVGKTVAADGIDWALSELPGEPRDATERSRHRDAERAAAEYVLTIFTNCLASGGVVAGGDGGQADVPILNGKESAIVQALRECGHLKGEELAAKAGYEYTGSFKETAAGLVRRGIIGNARGRGYYMTESRDSSRD